MTDTIDTPAPTRRPDNGSGTAALVLGIVAVVAALNGWWLLPLPIALVTAVLAIIFGVRGRRRADAGEASNRGQATAGLTLGIVASGLLALGAATFAVFSDEWRDEWDRSDTFDECIDDADDVGELRVCLDRFPTEAEDAGLVAA